METYNKIVALATEIVEAAEKMENRYTKAESGRQRKRINTIKKLATYAKRELVTKDGEV